MFSISVGLLAAGAQQAIFSSAATTLGGVFARAAVAGALGFVTGTLGAVVSGASLKDAIRAGANSAGTAVAMSVLKRYGAKVSGQTSTNENKGATPDHGDGPEAGGGESGSAGSRKGVNNRGYGGTAQGGSLIQGAITMEEFMALYGDNPFDVNSKGNWFGFANNGVGAAAFVASRVGGSVRILKSGRISIKHYTSGWRGGTRARIKTYNLTKWGGRAGTVSSFAGIAYAGYEFSLTDQSWGDYGAFGVSALSSGLTVTPEPITTAIGLGIGFVDAAGGFNDFYGFLDYNQSFYNTTGLIMVPYGNGFNIVPLR